MTNSLKSYILVAAQFSIIAFFVWYSSAWDGLATNVLTVIALIVGVWAVGTMRFRVSVLPDVLEKQKLYTGGPYRYVRHPMYSAVLLATFAWMCNRPDVFTVGAWIALIVVLVAKLNYEEKQLKNKFSNYKEYTQRTKRLIPYIY